MLFQYVTITTRDAILLALGMGIFADVLAIFLTIVLISYVRGNKEFRVSVTKGVIDDED